MKPRLGVLNGWSLASRHIDYYVMLSKHTHCDFSGPVMWLKIRSADLI